MMIAFSSALSIMLHGKLSIAILLTLLASVPVASFIWMQFPSFLNLFYRKCNSEIRRKSIVLDLLPQQGDPSHGLGKAQILELFQNCIKLASENRKRQQTNFQKASCTLEGGVKIYSMRVDSVHSEAYKVLGGMNRVGQGSEQGCKTKRSILILKVVLYLIQNNFLTCGQSKFCESCVLGILVIIPFQGR
ncbi:hypothetical protein DVH24_028150 [Malus domestica]|uniref:Condensin complex subunit 2 n=1 Tax=Malus domestica TaxID=3750 RepID=A0A498HG06_MALDO|nr:hypothetical protein DVH24_028150 [Malus domestica]